MSAGNFANGMAQQIEAMAREQAARNDAIRAKERARREAVWQKIQASEPVFAALAQACKAEMDGRIVKLTVDGEKLI